MVNRIQLIGRLGKDAEFSYEAYSLGLCKFSIATTDSWKDRDGRKTEKTQWFHVTIWGKLGEAVHSYLTKGKLVYIEGKMESNDVEKDGVKRTYWNVKADNIRMLGGGADRQEERDPGPPGPGMSADDNTQMQDQGYTEDDIPF